MNASKPAISFVAMPLLFAALALLQFVSPPCEAKRVAANTKSATPQLSADLSKAIADYKQGKYKDALDRLESADKKGLCNERTHYYIALCYQCMNQTVLSQMHYQWVMQYGKSQTLKAYSKSAYDQLAYYQAHRTYQGQGNNFARAGFS